MRYGHDHSSVKSKKIPLPLPTGWERINEKGAISGESLQKIFFFCFFKAFVNFSAGLFLFLRKIIGRI
jgi:hypothetical protein